MDKKKLMTFAAAMMMAMAMRAQSPSVLTEYVIPQPIINGNNLMQQRDGDFVLNFLVADCEDPHGFDVTIVGSRMFKVSRNDVVFIDSLFIDDGIAPFYLMAQDPRGGNLRVHIEADLENGNKLHIARFYDDDLATVPDEEVVVPFHEGNIWYCPTGILLSPEGDLIVRYCTFHDDGETLYHYARYGLDGTLKHTATNNSIPIDDNFGLFHNDPIEFFGWSNIDNEYSEGLLIDVFDSDINLIDSFKIDTVFVPDSIPVIVDGEIYKDTIFLESRSCERIIVDGEDLVIASNYQKFAPGLDYEDQEKGVMVARYDKRKHILKAIRYFRTITPYSKVLGLERTGDGCVYFVYYDQQVIAMKLDEIFSERWCRYLGYDYVWPFPEHSLQLGTNGDAPGIVISGVSGQGVFVLVINEEGVSIGESASALRPYAYWPNPAKDALHLHFSPDVQPAQAELYDLQGRLVRTWRNGLETLNLQGLAPGTYTLRVALKDGTVFTDKVVKE